VANVTTSPAKEYEVQSAPSSTENENFLGLLSGGPHNMVMVKCIFGGEERVAVGRMIREGSKEPHLRVLAVLVNERDNIQVATKTGEFFTPVGVEQLIN
jgi:hypothetical protein